MGLQSATLYVAALLRGLSPAIRVAPDYPPEQAVDFPFAASFPESGEAGGDGAGTILAEEVHTIRAEIHVGRKDLPRDVEKSIGYYEALAAALRADPSLGGNVDAVDSLTYRYGGMSWGGPPPNGVNTIGYEFRIRVLISHC